MPGVDVAGRLTKRRRVASNEDLFTTSESAIETDDEIAAPSGSEFAAE